MGSATVLYLHVGGMVVGSVPIFDGPVSRYVARPGVPMLSVPYRRASEVSSQPDDGSFSNCHRPSSEGTSRVDAPKRIPIYTVDRD